MTTLDTDSCNGKQKWFSFFSTISKMQRLEQAESRILSALGIRYTTKNVKIPFNESQIHTVTVNCESEKGDVVPHPIVLIHGFGAGVALWGSAMKRLAKISTIHAFDLPGFARSSRPKFSDDPKTAEHEMVDSIEQWREGMGLEKMNVVAHSFGGYLATSYAIKYPNRVDKLVLADPWGFNDMDPDLLGNLTKTQQFIFWAVQKFNPLATLRVVGSYGPNLMRKMRPDLQKRYSDDVYDYVYLCNSQNPTGESLFKNLSQNLGWAKEPMCKRFHQLDSSVPVTFIHGRKSWIDHRKIVRFAQDLDHVETHIVEDAGHHVYADNPTRFTEIVDDAIRGNGKTGKNAS